MQNMQIMQIINKLIISYVVIQLKKGFAKIAFVAFKIDKKTRKIDKKTIIIDKILLKLPKTLFLRYLFQKSMKNANFCGAIPRIAIPKRKIFQFMHNRRIKKSCTF